MPTRLVLVGGGHAHVQVLADLARRPLAGVETTLLVDRPVAVYSGMVPGFVAGHYRAGDVEIDLAPLAEEAGARLVVAPLERVDAAARRLHLATGGALDYDLASLNIGATVAGLDTPGVAEHAIPSRPISALVRRADELASGRPGPTRLVVVGGGAGGVELAFCLEARLHTPAGRASVTLVDAGDRLVPTLPAGVRRRLARAASARHLAVRLGARVQAVAADAVHLAGDTRLPADAVLWVTGAAAHGVLAGSALPVDDRGFVLVRDTLEVAGHDDLLAAGDCATLASAPATPKAGVYAVRQGPVLAANLRARLAGRPLTPYRPQKGFLALLNLGDGTAVGSKGGISFSGRWVMLLKDRIDRRFMRRFQRA